LSNLSISIDLDKIRSNANVVSGACLQAGVAAIGVVKACLGDRAVAEAMIAGGVSAIADSRLDNLKKLQNIGVPLMMLRQPMLSEIQDAVSIIDTFLVSELEVLEAVSQVAGALGLKSGVIVMVELGDLREGVMPEDIDRFIGEAKELQGIDVLGIGTNVACLQGVPPTPAMLEKLSNMAEQIRNRFKIKLPVVSGGNSGAWKLVEKGMLPSGINQLRFGEGILLGQETTDLDPIEGAYHDAVVLRAEIIEIKDKPVRFGERNSCSVMKRAILALGSQDICCGGLKPFDRDTVILRRSSDHLVVDISNSCDSYKVGDCMEFLPSYEAMLAAMTSPFVKKVIS
jgi:predicted amino acid racemase